MSTKRSIHPDYGRQIEAKAELREWSNLYPTLHSLPMYRSNGSSKKVAINICMKLTDWIIQNYSPIGVQIFVQMTNLWMMFTDITEQCLYKFTHTLSARIYPSY